MSKTTWIVQEFDCDPSPSIPALVRAIVDAEYPLVRCRVVPFTDQTPDIPDDIDPPILIYGMNTMIQNTRKHPKWRHGLFFDPVRFDPASYTRVLSDDMLNADAVLMTCEELAESGLDAVEEIFIRPNDDTKMFSGQVMPFRDYLRWYRSESDPDYVRLDPDLPILCSSRKEILAEYRTFVLLRKWFFKLGLVPSEKAVFFQISATLRVA